jgi:hypothetical protein
MATSSEQSEGVDGRRREPERVQRAAPDDEMVPALVCRFALQATGATEFEPPSVLAASAARLRSGLVVITGGRLPDGTLCRQTALYRPKERQWMLAPPSPAVDRSDHVSIAFERYVYIHGGIGPTGFLGEGDRVGIQDDVWRFDVSTAEWAQIEVPTDRDDIVKHRAGHTAVLYGRCALIYGGDTVHVAVVDRLGRDHYVVASDQCDGEVASFDLVSHRWERHSAGPCAARRRDHTAVALAGKMLCYGGRDAAGRETSDLLAYDLDTRRWVDEEPGGSRPPAMAGHAADTIEVAGEERMLILGGMRNCCFVYSPSVAWWTEVAVQPSHLRRSLGTVATIPGSRSPQLLCCGGVGVGGRPAKATVARFDVEERIVAEAPPLSLNTVPASIKAPSVKPVHEIAAAVDRLSKPAAQVREAAPVVQIHRPRKLDAEQQDAISSRLTRLSRRIAARPATAPAQRKLTVEEQQSSAARLTEVRLPQEPAVEVHVRKLTKEEQGQHADRLSVRRRPLLEPPQGSARKAVSLISLVGRLYPEPPGPLSSGQRLYKC